MTRPSTLARPRRAYAVDVAAGCQHRAVALRGPLAQRLVAVQHALLPLDDEVRARLLWLLWILWLLRVVREERHHAFALLQRGKQHELEWRGRGGCTAGQLAEGDKDTRDVEVTTNEDIRPWSPLRMICWFATSFRSAPLKIVICSESRKQCLRSPRCGTARASPPHPTEGTASTIE